MNLNEWIGRLVLQPFWRLTRGQTLGAQGVIIDDKEQVLLVRHGYRSGWHFPGGGVEWGETVEAALRRELFEEVGIKPEYFPKLHGVYSNFENFPGDHILVFLIKEWELIGFPEPNREIQEIRFFQREQLPETLVDGARRRLGEIFDDDPVVENW